MYLADDHESRRCWKADKPIGYEIEEVWLPVKTGYRLRSKLWMTMSMCRYLIEDIVIAVIVVPDPTYDALLLDLR